MGRTSRLAAVTGANSGMGKATALGLAREGCRVLLLVRSESRSFMLEFYQLLYVLEIQKGATLIG